MNEDGGGVQPGADEGADVRPGAPVDPGAGAGSIPPLRPQAPEPAPPPGAGYPVYGAAYPGYGAAGPGVAGWPPPGAGGYRPPGFFPDPADPLVSADFPGWWNRSLALVKAAWRPMVILQVAAVLPFLVPGLIAMLIWEGDLFRSAQTTGTVDFDGHAVLTALWWAVPAGLVTAVWLTTVQLAAVHLLVQSAVGRPLSVAAALRAGLRRVLPLFGWYLAAVPVLLIGFVCCVLPGYYVAAVLALLYPVVLIERGSGLRRCFRLFNAHFGLALGRYATIFVVSGFLSGIQTAVAAALTGGGMFVRGGPSTTASVITALVSALFAVALSVVIPALLLTTYADLRARREPFATRDLVAIA